MLAYTAGDSLQAITRAYGVAPVRTLEETIRPTTCLNDRRAASPRRPLWRRFFGRRQQASRA